MKKCTRLFVFLFLLLLLLAGCTPKRILTDLSEEDFIAYVALQDGYLHFTDDQLIQGSYLSSLELDMEIADTPDYSDVVADLGVDPVAMSNTLPEKYHLTPEALQDVYISGATGEYPFGGYRFLLRGDPGEYYVTDRIAVYPEFRISMKRMTGAEKESPPFHDHCPVFYVLPWEMTRYGKSENQTPKYEIYRSEINGHPVGVTHRRFLFTYLDHFPGAKWDYYYGGFYVDNLAVCIESDFSYCTQEEFIDVFLAIFDYLTELKEA